MAKLKAIEMAVIHSPMGMVALEAHGGKLVSLRIDCGLPPSPPARGVLSKARDELNLYFAGKLSRFTIPVEEPLAATPFQKSVWAEMRKIPYGQTRTYGDLAKTLATAPRAVGQACGKNPIPIITPCHRVVSSNGLGGYSGDWESGKALSQKEILLKIESQRGDAA